ncbi:MAG: holo-ACP synthase [Gammaproteobacteria bacterium]|nr:holo-ACP synthase [Gammaproteobacteria bacterium]
MISGIGIDIVQVDRVAAVYAHYGHKFARRVLAPDELKGFETSQHPVRYLAMRFAAKEATTKALGTGFRQGVALRTIEVAHNAAGKPSLRLHGAAASLAEQQGVYATHVSLTDEREYAAAVVVFETR